MMSKKRFNDFQCPTEFMSYMSRLEDTRRRVLGKKFGTNPVTLNSGLLKRYKTHPAMREQIRETLFWVNIKYLHEVFMTKLKPNLFLGDTLDIYQELTIALIRGIDKALMKDPLTTTSLFWSIHQGLLASIGEIMKTYYDHRSVTEYLEDPDSLEFEYPEIHDQAEVREALWFCKEARGERGQAIVRQYYLEGKTLDEIGYYFGLTLERVRQIREKTIAEARDVAYEAKAGRTEAEAFRRKVLTVLKHWPGVKYVMFESPGVIGVNMPLAELRGIDPRQWLIVSEFTPGSNLGSLYNRLVMTGIPKRYLGRVFDTTLSEIGPGWAERPFYYDIKEELRALKDSKIKRELQEIMAIETVHRRILAESVKTEKLIGG